MRSLFSRPGRPPRRRRRRRLRRTRLSLTLARLRRSTVFTLAAAASAAGLAGTATAQMLGDAAEARDRWGALVEVDVVVREVAAGEVIAADDLRRERRPRQLLPAGAVVASAVGRVALATLVKGDVVAAARVGDDLMPAGWRAIAVPPPGTGGHPDVAPGDLVEVLDVGTGAGASVAEGVVVAVRENDGMVTVAVPADAAAGVAYAAVAGTAVLALTAGPTRR